jgi:tetratricopeptide (TPR) repeat protein
MYLKRGELNYRRRRRDDPTRILIYLILIVVGVFVLWQTRTGRIQPVGIPSPTPTRSALSFAEEAEAAFSAGRLTDAVRAYVQATQADPTNVGYWINLARVQVYAGRTAADADAAVNSAQTATVLASENSMAYAVLALALHESELQKPETRRDFGDAEQAAARAIQLDGNNALAHAYYSEILTSASNWNRAGDEARVALSLNPENMDVRRVYGYYLESTGSYEEAITQYRRAATINPNLSLLHIRLGLNYRALEEYDLALEFFRRANALDPKELLPYLSISRTYFQIGEYNRATQWLEEALSVALETGSSNEEIADIYGRKGMIEHRALNFEGALVDLECAVFGCDADVDGQIYPIQGLPLKDGTTLSYYYTYSSVLAAYYYCDGPKGALALIDQIAAYPRRDDVVDQIISENRNICNNYIGGKTAEATGLPTSTLAAPGATPSR